MGVDADRSLRVSVGWSSTDADVERFVDVFPGIVERLRGLRARMTAAVRASLNHAVLYVRDAARGSPPFYQEALGFEVVGRWPATARGVPARGRDRRTTTISGCSRSAPQAPGPEPGRVGLYHLAWQVDTIHDLADDARASARASARSSARATTA